MRQKVNFKSLLCFIVVFALSLSSSVDADSFSVALKGWNATRSTDDLDDDDGLLPGVSLQWALSNGLRISVGYHGGEVDFSRTGTTTTGSIEEVDSDLIVGWGLGNLVIGAGYRYTEFTTTVIVPGGPSIPASATESAGPMAYLGGGGSFSEPSQWGYYWGATYMFEDLEDGDGSQEHFQGEVGFRWTSRQDLSVLVGYRYKEYSGDNAGGLTFQGPAISLAYTFR